jgi:hypothetical protein
LASRAILIAYAVLPEAVGPAMTVIGATLASVLCLRVKAFAIALERTVGGDRPYNYQYQLTFSFVIIVLMLSLQDSFETAV